MNVYLLEEPDGSGVTVYDAGEKGMAGAIVAAAQRFGGITRVVLGPWRHRPPRRRTALRAHTDVICHPEAVACSGIWRQCDYWQDELPLDVRLLHGLRHRFVTADLSTSTAPPRRATSSRGSRSSTCPVTPRGSSAVAPTRPGSRFVSDCFYMTDMHGRPQPPAVPHDAYNLDTAQARRSIAKLAAMQPATVLPGHLGLLTGPDVVAQLEAAAA